MTRSRLIVLVLIGGLFVWFFSEALVGGGVFVFRDAGHYYYPLFQFVASQWKAGRLPLWNPYENLGVPLAGNATASAFYPGTLIFLLPLEYAWAYKLYVMGHVLLAAGTTYWTARRWGASVPAAAGGAISYAFSGNVLFQYSNVIFLVGAAWLPLALLAADRMLTETPEGGGEGPEAGGRRRAAGSRARRGSPELAGSRARQKPSHSGRAHWAVAFGVVLALMTLGGNAEMAYHAGLIAALYGLWLWWHGRRRHVRRSLPHSGPFPRVKAESSARVISPTRHLSGRGSVVERFMRCRPVLLTLAAATAFGLSAVQVLPSLELSLLSGRAASPVARSIYEIPSHLGRGQPAFRGDGTGWADGLFCRRLEPGTHQEHVYQFSVGPWRVAEYVWPNVGGRQFPVHRRWLAVIPGEGRIWVPSLYMGLVPLILAVGSMRLVRGSPRQRWLSWMVVFSVAASFGWYGLGWLVHEIRVACGADASGPWWVGAPFGGLYWLMTVLLPGYVYFRYPAKLLVIAALALSLLAARGWDRAFERPSARLRRSVLWLGGVSLLMATVALAVRPFWAHWLAGAPPDVLFGPLDPAGAARDLFMGFMQTAVLCALFWWLLRRASAGADKPPAALRWPAAAAVALVAADLAVANGWMVACAPAAQWENRPKLAAVLQEDRARRGDAQPYRVFRHPIWAPPSWRSTGSRSRLTDAMRWDRDTLWPKYNLLAGIPVAEVQGTMKPLDYQVFLWVVKSGGPSPPPPGRPDPHRQPHAPGEQGTGPPLVPGQFGLDAVGAEYVILPGDRMIPNAEPINLDHSAARGTQDVSLWRIRDALPRAWIVHQVEVLPPLESKDPRRLWRRTEEVLSRKGTWPSLRESAVVETGEAGLLPCSPAEASQQRLARGCLASTAGWLGQSKAVPQLASFSRLRRVPGAARLPLKPQGRTSRPWHPTRSHPPRRDGLAICGSGTDLRTARAPSPRSLAPDPQSAPARAEETCRVVRHDPLCVEIEAELLEPGLVVLGDQFYPGWKLEVETASGGRRAVPILRTNRVMRGAWLPAGDHRLIYRYRPASFLWGAAISAMGWIALGAITLATMIVVGSRRRASRNEGFRD